MLTAMDEELLTASQAGEDLSASSQTIRNWIRSDRLHAVRIGNRFLIPRSEVERMLGDVLSAHDFGLGAGVRRRTVGVAGCAP